MSAVVGEGLGEVVGEDETAANQAWRQYLCRVCGLIYDEAKGDADSGLAPGTRFEDIPDDWACPICGVGKADFEPYTPAPAPAVAAGSRAAGGRRPAVRGAMSGATQRVKTSRAPGVVIVGAGRAGWQVAQFLRERSATLAITIVSACDGDVYDKPTLSVAVSRGLAPDALVREGAAQAAQRLNVRLVAGAHAVGVDAAAHRLRTTRGTLRYRQLVLAQGAQPALPACLPAAHVWRINDLVAYQKLRRVLDGASRHIAIVGAGLVGCELANDLALAGHRITLLDVQTRPLAALLPAQASTRLLAAWQDLPINFLGGAQVLGVVPVGGAGGGGFHVALQGSTPLQADQVIAATGLRASPRLAASAGLDYDRQAGGISADAATLRTRHPDIHALGDCVVVQGQASRYIEPIARQAQAIAACIVPGPDAVLAGTSAPAPLLRVKTSRLPITVVGVVQAGSAWFTERDDAQGLLMHQRSASGAVAASLRATPPSARMGTGGTGGTRNTGDLRATG